MKRLVLFGAIILATFGATILLVALVSDGPGQTRDASTAPTPTAAPVLSGCVGSIDPSLCKIDHMIFIVQENRSFDHYFGMYESPSGARVDGIPVNAKGEPKQSTCNPHPVLKGCLLPYHSSKDVQLGGPHEHEASVIDVHHGKMDGFINGIASNPQTKLCVLKPDTKRCKAFQGPDQQPDAMSYRMRADLKNYYALADYGVLMDRFFMAVDSFTLPAHMLIFSGWSATCSGSAKTCESDTSPDPGGNFNWTPIAYLLDKQNVSWGWFVGEDTNVCVAYPHCPQEKGDDYSPTNWNPPPGFNYIQDKNQLDHILPISDFRDAIAKDRLPAVSWVIPSERVSEHPGKGSMRPGYDYVTKLINDIGRSEAWEDTAIFLYWDDWGGFYDHVEPIRVDELGYGIRVPSLLISPYAREAYVDHQMLTSDAYLKFIEDRFLDGKRLDPAEGYMPTDARPFVREEAEGLGNVSAQFDFNQPPRPPPVLPEDPR